MRKGEVEEEEEVEVQVEEELRGIVRGDMFSAEREESSSRLCPLVLLVQVAWKNIRTLRREIRKGLGSGLFCCGAEKVAPSLWAEF